MKHNYLFCIKCKKILNNIDIVCPNCKDEYSQVILLYKLDKKINKLNDLYKYYLPFGLFKKNDFNNCSLTQFNNRIWVKNEGENDCKSIKEKELMIGVRISQCLNFKKPYCVSSGTGIFVSNQLAIKLHIPIKIYSPKTNKKIYKNQILLGKDYEDTFKKIVSKKDNNSFNITPGINPYSQEGAKVISWQLIQTNKKIDFIIIPCGNGSSLWGIYKGYIEAKQNGLIKTIPRICGVELINGPIGRSLISMKVKKNKKILNSKAHGIDTKESFCIQKAIIALKKTKGVMISVREDEIVNSYNELHQKGFKSNYTAAASLAGAIILNKKYPQTTICCILTADE